MDAPRSILLGLLIAGPGACASWPTVESSASATDAPLRSALPPERLAEPRCDTPPIIRGVADGFAVLEACEPTVALYRRDVVAGQAPEFLGICTVPCADPGPVDGSVCAYTTAGLVDVDGELRAGPDSPEAYVTTDR